MWRKQSTGAETVLATVTHTFPPGTGVQFETDLMGLEAPAVPGDLLIYRFTNVDPDSGTSYTPNGDGAFAGGGARVPSLTLPPP